MSPRALPQDDKSFVPVLYMAMELSNRNWMLLFGGGARCCQLSIAAGELLSLNEAVLKARERFGLPACVQVVSCYEAGRDGFWLHGYVESIGIENVVVVRELECRESRRGYHRTGCARSDGLVRAFQAEVREPGTRTGSGRHQTLALSIAGCAP